LFAGKAKAIEPLLKVLDDIPVEVGGGYGIDLRCGTVIKAWNLWSCGKKLTEEGVQMEVGEREGRPVLAEKPRIGGIDIDWDERQEEAEALPEEAAPGDNGAPIDIDLSKYGIKTDAKGRFWLSPKKGDGKELGPYDTKKQAQAAKDDIAKQQA